MTAAHAQKRQIVQDWVQRFNAHGLNGLVNGKAPDGRSKLNEAQRQALAKDAILRGSPLVVEEARSNTFIDRVSRCKLYRLKACSSHAMEEGLASDFQNLCLEGTKEKDKLMVDLEAALLDYCDCLAWWPASGDQTNTDAKQIMPRTRLLYMYMDLSTAEWCVKEHCLVCNSNNFGAMVTLLPPYMTNVTSEEVCTKLYAFTDGSQLINYLELA
ncbi:Cytokinin glycosidase [Parasponia andersonii]|uniref:Cytokinin glycosidase n=1 Tax=Parasponia andersonii TaxID=3476 RepID=A0A2P5AU03_PARAD|nr:Cytokinin glycosidase [Parasponia andersonii]